MAHIPRISVTSGHELDHPSVPGRKLKIGVTLFAELGKGEDVDAACRSLQSTAETYIAQHVEVARAVGFAQGAPAPAPGRRPVAKKGARR